MEAFTNWCDANGRVDHAVGDAYFALRTARYLLMDFGRGLVLASATVLALVHGLARSPLDGTSWLRTPARRMTFIAIGIGVILLGAAAETYSLHADLDRFTFPMCADSIGIPMRGLMLLTMVLLPVLTVLGGVITLGFGRIPVSLSQWDVGRPKRSWVVTILIGLVWLATLFVTVSITVSSAWPATPAGVVALYLLASTRAALLVERWVPEQVRHDVE
ncbi:MAG: hypothetical protein P0Y59_13875 [Candidatus Sphingomonas phytovorans]|nr:hypothetical protein [Sphingomonas sp.]WEJ98045.1 MAG: hypothetical protein P0Y59_13875 [Sphingomonas sp.]